MAEEMHQQQNDTRTERIKNEWAGSFTEVQPENVEYTENGVPVWCIHL